MVWLQENKTGWRAAILVLLGVAILGPWWFDLIVVPAQYECTTAIRLDGDFCGIPMAGAWILIWVITVPINSIRGLVTGAITLADLRSETLRGILGGLLLCALLLPFIHTLFLFRHRESRRQQVFSLIVWGLAVGAGLWFGLSSHPNLFWVLWGVWLYSGLAAGALILEALMLLRGRVPH
jgi:hypothetical protein